VTLHERLDTRINLQNLLSAIVIAGGLIAWANSMSSRVTALEEFKRSQEALDRRQDEESNRRQDQILKAVQDLGAKVDRISGRR
jgi:outer membrane murein-binding lipoprotein Lpp